ncbi:hypothetical protein D3C87_2183190 [compost metagenome]
MVDKASSKRAGSSLPSISMVLVKLPPAMVCAACTARFNGVTMLRVSNQASSTVNNAATTDTTMIPFTAVL